MAQISQIKNSPRGKLDRDTARPLSRLQALAFSICEICAICGQMRFFSFAMDSGRLILMIAFRVC